MTSTTSPSSLPTPPPESGITPDDVIRARERWKALAPPAFKQLLDAKVTDGTSD